MRKQYPIYAGIFVVAAALTAIVAGLLVNIDTRKDEASQYPLRIVEIGQDELDPAVWGQNFPYEYDSFVRTEENYGQTPFGGADPYDKLERFPALKRLWAGYAFSKDYNEERGHYYALIDQKETKRQDAVKQPGACANCHAAEAPLLITQMGWEQFNATPYKEISSTLHTGSSCRDCHNPETMELWISRPAFKNAMEKRGIDLSRVSRQEMRTFVCAQCHVEYYFAGEKKLLTYPWEKGLSIDAIEQYYDGYGFKDWQHAETGAPMLKMQHPEFELFSTGIHYRSGVACADCHMPYVRQGSIKVSDHWLRSPLINLDNACGTCHKRPNKELEERVLVIQNKTAELLQQSSDAILAAMDGITAARTAGASDEQLAEVWQLHRHAQMRWDFIASENSTGFHSPQEAARVLADAIDLARQAQIKALEIQHSLAAVQTSAAP
jgi:nitrite reductase (cytochrome c-552)